MNQPINIALLILKVRKRLGITQQEFAYRLGVALPTISRWENKIHKPSPLALDKVEALLVNMGDEGKAIRDKYFRKSTLIK